MESKQLAVERPLVEAGARYRTLIAELADAREMIADDDPEITEMAKADVARLEPERDALEQKLRELLEKRFEHEDKVAEDSKPVLTEEQFVGKLAETYLPGLQSVVEAGGIEADFIKEFPKVATQIEHRFQSGSDLIGALVKEVDELREYIGVRKKINAETEKREASSAASGHFDGLMTSLSDKGELFEKLKDQETKDDFVKWASAEDTGLKIAEKEINTISENDVMATWLLYVQQHPDKFAKKAEKSKEDAQLASGGGGPGSSTSKSKEQSDELSDFEAELKESLANIEY